MVYIVYSRNGLALPDSAKFQRIYSSMEKAQQYCNKKNSESKRYFFWMAQTVMD